MRIVMFYHSLLSDWNHGNAHFLRGVSAELIARGHRVRVCEPADNWSLTNLLADAGPAAVAAMRAAYPTLKSTRYRRGDIGRRAAALVDGADLVIVHEWNDPELIAAVGRLRCRGNFRLLFHDTHHRAASDRDALAGLDLSNYDGVLAFGGVIRDLYLRRRWTDRAWVWHEAADVRLFHPPRRPPRILGDLVWIGNWGDDERTAELMEFLLGPVQSLRLRAKVYGVRYPSQALAALERAGIEYGGYLPNFEAPRVMARYRMTVHIPRRPYAAALPGIPTIRVFEALACGLPLICAPWRDTEGLFNGRQDYLSVADGPEMTRAMRLLLSDKARAAALAAHGRATILARHTCAHRVDELLEICNSLQGSAGHTAGCGLAEVAS